jgi:hypothetical protein
MFHVSPRHSAFFAHRPSSIVGRFSIAPPPTDSFELSCRDDSIDPIYRVSNVVPTDHETTTCRKSKFQSLSTILSRERKIMDCRYSIINGLSPREMKYSTSTRGGPAVNQFSILAIDEPKQISNIAVGCF